VNHEARAMPSRRGAVDSLALWWAARARVWRWGAVLAIAAALWWSSSRSGSGAASQFAAAYANNAMHAVAFAGLAAALWFACRARPLPAVHVAAAIAAWCGAVLYGVVDELHQRVVPGRSPSIVDVATDACGAALAIWWLRFRFEQRGRRFVGVALLAACASSAWLATVGPW
jgi:hypothetical protein